MAADGGKAIPCAHWSPADLPGGGRCAIGKQGGYPNVHHCFACLSFEGNRESTTPADAAAQIRFDSETRRRGRGCCGQG